VDVRDIIYGLKSSYCTSTHPGVTKGDQDGPQYSVKNVELIKSILKVEKLFYRLEIQ
jgi:hypothetical protein